MRTKLRCGVLLVLALGLAGLAARSGLAQEKDPIVERMRKDITFLASDECEGRGVGTLGLDLAAQYIAVQFKMAGLKPGGVNGTYFQPFPFATNPQLDGESTLVQQGKKKATFKQGVDFQVLAVSAPGKVNADVVFVGYGVTGNGIAYDDYAGIDVKGKIVIALRRLPRWSDKVHPFGEKAKNYLSGIVVKQAFAQANKAAAVILVNDASDAKDELMNFATLSRAISTLSIPYLQMKRSILDEILKASTGKDLAETEKAIDADLKPHSAVLKGIKLAMNVKVKRKEVMVKNVIGYLDGSGPLAKESVVVGAHYDHLGYGGSGGSLAPKLKGKIHYGADDNGSGTTSVIELARRFGAMKDREGRRMVFMTFTAEESGLIGSRHYCQADPLFPLKNTAAMFNLDMVGRLKDPVGDGKSKLLVEGVGTAKEFDGLIAKLNPGFEVVKEMSAFGASDQASFYDQKIPVLFFTGLHSDYHRPSDTADKINVAGMKRVADYAERIIDHLRTEPQRPEYVEIKSTFKGGGPKGPRMGILPDYMFGGKGLQIEGVSKDGPAEKAGLKKGDIIIEIAGKSVANVNAYMTVMGTQKTNVAIDVKILRDNKEMKLKVTPQ